MENFIAKQFTIIDPKGMNTVIYEVYVTKREYRHKYPKFTVERLHMTEVDKGDYSCKTFYVDDPDVNGNQLMIFTFSDGYVDIRNGLLINDVVRITKSTQPFRLNQRMIVGKGKAKIEEYLYSGLMDRHHYGVVIDPETTEEIKPALEYDETTGQVLYKVKLKSGKSYFQYNLY